MQSNSTSSLRRAIREADRLSAGIVTSAGSDVTWRELLAAGPIDRPASKLAGQSVLLATHEPFPALRALIQLDGIARRMVLCPPDLSIEALKFVAETAECDLILADDGSTPWTAPRIEQVAPVEARGLSTQSFEADCAPAIETEWVLLTSGTTGTPKLVVHSLQSLIGAIVRGPGSQTPVVWSTFYDIRRYGGLQIFLRAALTGASLVLRGATEPVEDYLARAGAAKVTHLSGTPSHWRSALRSGAANRIAPAYVRLSGEIADQAVLNWLRIQYPAARIGHAFASTEAGVAFEVKDELAGIPEETIRSTSGVAMKVEEQTLRIQSQRTASGYLGADNGPLKDAEGFADTGDVLELRGERYYFLGRRDGTINVGGLKVHPEEVEAVLNRHPEVNMALVKAKKSPVTGALVVADIVLKSPAQENGRQDLLQEILQFCRRELAAYKVPALINVVPGLAVAATGKLVRPHA